MAEAIATLLPWLDEKKRALFRKIAEAGADISSNPIDALMRGSRGALNAGADLGDMITGSIPGAVPGQLGAASRGELGTGTSAVEQAGELAGPPIKTPLMGILAGWKGAERLGPQYVQKLKSAMEAEQKGMLPDEIWKKFGAEKNPSGEWRFEIPDVNAKLMFGAGQETPMGSLMQHPELYKAYPELLEHIVKYKGARHGGSGEFWAKGYAGQPGPAGVPGIKVEGRGQDELLNVLLHEAEHGVQRLEGSPSHGSSTQMIKDLAEKLAKGAGDPTLASLLGEKRASELYRRNPQEMEARAVQNRQKLDPNLLATNRPGQMGFGYDMPPEKALSNDALVAELQKHMGIGNKFGPAPGSVPGLPPTSGAPALPTDPRQLMDLERQIQTGVHPAQGEDKYELLRQIAAQLALTGTK